MSTIANVVSSTDCWQFMTLSVTNVRVHHAGLSAAETLLPVNSVKALVGTEGIDTVTKLDYISCCYKFCFQIVYSDNSTSTTDFSLCKSVNVFRLAHCWCESFLFRSPRL